MERTRQHIDKAHSNLRAMKLMFDNDLFDWTIICGYYAMYHAVLASLFKIGIGLCSKDRRGVSPVDKLL
jgi:uncharacterized protein (UPF0332 family)